jgi:hypothetical protein
MDILLSFFIMLLGILIYAFTVNPKLSWISQQMIWCGLLVTLLRFQSTLFHLPSIGK